MINPLGLKGKIVCILLTIRRKSPRTRFPKLLRISGRRKSFATFAPHLMARVGTTFAGDFGRENRIVARFGMRYCDAVSETEGKLRRTQNEIRTRKGR